MPRERDDLENDTTPLGFGDAAPVKRDAPPLRVDKYDGHPDYDDPLPDEPDEPEADDGEPVRRKKKLKPKPDLLQKLDAIPEPPWARGPLILLAIGLLLCLIPIIVVAVKAAERPAGALPGEAVGMVAGGILTMVLFAAVMVQVLFAAGIMIGVGVMFGIDYGPLFRGLLKLAAVMALVDGVTGGLALALYAGCGGPGVVMALCVSVVLTYALIQQQFELTGFEAMVTVGLIDLAAIVLSAVAQYVVLAKLR